MADQQRPTVRRRRLGRIMRNIRETRSLTIPDAAKLLNRDVSAISRLETGHRGIRRPALENMLDHYGMTNEALREHLFDLARSSYRKGWWQGYGSMLSPEAMDLISLEADALSIEFLELVLIPGLLQTEAYARAVMSIGPFAYDRERIDKLVDIRLKRQEIIGRKRSPRLWAIMDEAALHRQVGGPNVMRSQLDHLAALSRLSNVSLQVLPYSAGAYQGMTGAFKILRVGEHGELQVIAVDSLTQISYREEIHEIRTYADAFNHLRATALPEEDSQTLIDGLRSQL